MIDPKWDSNNSVQLKSKAKPITPEQLASSGTEHGHQAALFCWANDHLHLYPKLKWMYSIPNGFYATSSQKGKMKAEGLKNGVWDIFLPVPTFYNSREIKWCGLYIEMKVDSNGLTKDQSEFAHALYGHYKFEICWTWEEAVKAIKEYLK